jgi:hypothetical protein
MQLKIEITTVVVAVIIIIIIIIIIIHKFCGTPTKTQIKAYSNTNIHAINYSFLRMEDPCLKTHTHTHENIKMSLKAAVTQPAF